MMPKVSPVEVFLCALTGFGDESRGVALSFDAERGVLSLPETPLLAHNALLSLRSGIEMLKIIFRSEQCNPVCVWLCVCVCVCYLQVCELPGVIVRLYTLTGKRLPEVHFDQLPVRPVADVSKHAANTQKHHRCKVNGQFNFVILHMWICYPPFMHPLWNSWLPVTDPSLSSPLEGGVLLQNAGDAYRPCQLDHFLKQTDVTQVIDSDMCCCAAGGPRSPCYPRGECD